MTTLDPTAALPHDAAADDRDPDLFAHGERVPRAPGVVGSTLFAIFTLGVGPLIAWPLRFRDFADAERVRLLRLCDWLRLRTNDEPSVVVLREDVDRIAPSDTLQWVAWLCAAGFTIYLLATLSAVDPSGYRFGPFEAAVQATYGSARPDVVYVQTQHGGPLAIPLGRQRQLSFEAIERTRHVWLWLIGIGYAAHWLQVRRHADQVRNSLGQFNAIARMMNLAPVEAPSVGLGLRPMWVLAAAAMLTQGVLWAVPFALAGGVQSRAARARLVRARHAVAARLGAVARRVTVGRCDNDQCQAPLPAGARFCPRCGKQLG